MKKFDRWAKGWWDLEKGEVRLLHKVNPVRLSYIDKIAQLAGKTVLDVGCGGGILSEGMAARGAKVTGIDLAEEALNAAGEHLRLSGLSVDYRKISVDQLAMEQTQHYDIVTCMEVLEHVPDPATVVRACGKLVKPSGYVFFSTLNRNAKSFLLAIVGAEYILKLLPRGTHSWRKFIKPSDLESYCRSAGLQVQEMKGLLYNPVTRKFSLGPSVDVNYLVCARPVS